MLEETSAAGVIKRYAVGNYNENTPVVVLSTHVRHRTPWKRL
jgi:hypothetical protein